MRAYHFVPERFGLEDISLRRLKIARMADLNDPFEARAIAMGNRARRRSFEKYVTELSRNRGLLCFSRDWRNPVQWSHYADRHRGICLGFDIADDSVTAVSYRRDRYPADELDVLGGIDSPMAEAKFFQMLNTKFQHWEYENEVRMFMSLTNPDSRGLFFAEFSPNIGLAEVIIGHRCEVKRSVIEQLLGDWRDAVTIKKARLAFESYEVVEQKDRSRW